MLSKLWLSFFVVGFLAAGMQWVLEGDALVFQRVVASIFEMSKTAVNIALGLIGALSFWLGIFTVAERAGLVDKLAYGLTPLLRRLMPEIPDKHSAFGSITMNLSANILGLDNAATPLGIRAMHDLQSINPNPQCASNAQILFLVLNSSSVTLFPITVFVYRAQQGAVAATDVFMPILLATSASTFVGLMAVAWMQRIRLWDWVVMAYLASFMVLIMSIIAYFIVLSAEQLATQSALVSNLLILSFVVFTLLIAHRKKIVVYDSFIDGAKQGFELSISLIPYLLAMLVAIAVLRSSGVIDLVVDTIRYLVLLLGLDSGFVEALPTALMKPFSGSGSRAMMLEAMDTYGVDSFVARVSAVIQGSTETTFYVIAVYFGAVGIKNTRHAIGCGLCADLAGIISAIAVCYWFFA